MRAIVKGKEPASLAEHRCQPNATYDNYADKDTLRQRLVAEQRGICCYCLSRIEPQAGSMKIAHWHSQTLHPAEQLDYGNLLAACMGGEGHSPWEQHCDTRQGNRDISRNPANPEHRIESFLHFAGDGTVSSPDDETFEREINEVLNLNFALLKRNRKDKLDGFTCGLPKRGELQRERLERLLRKWSGDSDGGALEPYCQVVVYWLRKRLQRAGGQASA